MPIYNSNSVTYLHHFSKNFVIIHFFHYMGGCKNLKFWDLYMYTKVSLVFVA